MDPKWLFEESSLVVHDELVVVPLPTQLLMLINDHWCQLVLNEFHFLLAQQLVLSNCTIMYILLLLFVFAISICLSHFGPPTQLNFFLFLFFWFGDWGWVGLLRLHVDLG